jgi:hypothetical protein
MKMVRIPKVVVAFLLSVHPLLNAQVDTSYAFIVAGHAYGSHDGVNIGLHPALLNSLDSGFDPDAALFVFTGDIINHSTTESWQQVENEMASYALPYYYVMGNHDENDIGQQVFEDKHGGTYYSFYVQHDLFIVLNSTEAGRSISSNQIEFLEEQINQADDTIRNAFIFFHEVLWNSHVKYLGVRSNNRSRYDEMVDYSNYWEEVHPILVENPEKEFFLITGDVGGRPDAIAAFYDRWDHITFLSSGMGEVADENYLLVHVNSKDSVEFELVPLNSDTSLSDIEYFSVPPAPGEISGPVTVTRGSGDVEYAVPEVFNASSYEWELPEGASGSSTSTHIMVDFEVDFTGDTLSVQAAREGFGKGPASSLVIGIDATFVEMADGNAGAPQVDLIETNDQLTVGFKGFEEDALWVRIFDTSGRILKSKRIGATGGIAEIRIAKNDLSKGIIFLSVTTPARQITKKFVVR